MLNKKIERRSTTAILKLEYEYHHSDLTSLKSAIYNSDDTSNRSDSNPIEQLQISP